MYTWECYFGSKFIGMGRKQTLAPYLSHRMIIGEFRVKNLLKQFPVNIQTDWVGCFCLLVFSFFSFLKTQWGFFWQYEWKSLKGNKAFLCLSAILFKNGMVYIGAYKLYWCKQPFCSISGYYYVWFCCYLEGLPLFTFGPWFVPFKIHLYIYILFFNLL